jgi:hypothetical protein
MTPKKLKRKKPAKAKKTVRKKAAVMKKQRSKKAAPKRKPAPKKSTSRGNNRSLAAVAFDVEGKRARSGGQSGNLQGLSDVETADSESVDELLEEGNAFEAEVIQGVQGAPDADHGEVRTHEVPEDDVPQEYLDKDE